VLEHRVPDLEKRTDRLDNDLHGQLTSLGTQLTSLQGDLRDQLKMVNGEVHDQLKAMSLSVAGLKINMARLCGRPQTKPCSPEALVAEAKSVTRIQAQFFDTADLQITHGATPAVADARLVVWLPHTNTFDGFAYATPKKVDKPEFANVLMWSSAADAAHWHREGKNVKITFANGDATFMLQDRTSKEEADALVHSLNETVDALKSAGSAPPGRK
jgi:hypothetical protein